MTPEEKAKELVKKFTTPMPTASYHVLHASAKECAIICVEEIMAADPHFFYPGRKVSRVSDHSTKDYWKQVKKEIEKL